MAKKFQALTRLDKIKKLMRQNQGRIREFNSNTKDMFKNDIKSFNEQYGERYRQLNGLQNDLNNEHSKIKRVIPYWDNERHILVEYPEQIK